MRVRENEEACSSSARFSQSLRWARGDNPLDENLPLLRHWIPLFTRVVLSSCADVYTMSRWAGRPQTENVSPELLLVLLSLAHLARAKQNLGSVKLFSGLLCTLGFAASRKDADTNSTVSGRGQCVGLFESSVR